MFKVCFYVPLLQAEAVKNAMFKAGAGKIGDYACCAFQTMGQGQFMPLPGSNAYIGEIHRIEKVEEYKIEMVCSEEAIQDVLVAMREAHPYETPAYDVIRLEDF